MSEAGALELRPITMDDLGLYVRMARDPLVMAELGGPLPEAGLEEKLRGIVRDVEADRLLYFAIVPEEAVAAGTVCIWDHAQDGETITEIGWMVAPEFQGRGLATEAVRAILELARGDGRWKTIHAYPGVSNAPSNAICRKTGFERVGERDIEYSGRTLRCNHWRLELR